MDDEDGLPPAAVPVSAKTESSREGLADLVFSDWEVAEIPRATESGVVAGSAYDGKGAGLHAVRRSRRRELRMEQDGERAAAIRARERLADGSRAIDDVA